MNDKKTSPEIFTREARKMVDDYLVKVKTELSRAGLSPKEIDNVVKEIQNHILELCRIKNKDRVITTDEVSTVLNKLGSPEELSRSTLESLDNELAASPSFIQEPAYDEPKETIASPYFQQEQTTNVTSQHPSIITPPSTFKTTTSKLTKFFDDLGNYTLLFAIWFILPSFLALILSDSSFYEFDAFYFEVTHILSVFLIIEWLLMGLYLFTWILYVFSSARKQYFNGAFILHKNPYFTYLFLIMIPIFLIDDFYYYYGGIFVVFLMLTQLAILFVVAVEIKYFVFKKDSPNLKKIKLLT